MTAESTTKITIISTSRNYPLYGIKKQLKLELSRAHSLCACTSTIVRAVLNSCIHDLNAWEVSKIDIEEGHGYNPEPPVVTEIMLSPATGSY